MNENDKQNEQAGQPYAATACSQLDIADIKWEYEDELPGMEDDEFDRIFPSSRIIGNAYGGVRMYPYVEIGGARVWIAGLANGAIEPHPKGGCKE